MNFGHGELGFGAWPSAKSKPVAEYCTVLSVSTPSAFDAPTMTAAASCAEGVAVASASPTISPSPARLFLTIDHRLSAAILTSSNGQDRIQIAINDGVQTPATRQEVATALGGSQSVRGGRRRQPAQVLLPRDVCVPLGARARRTRPNYIIGDVMARMKRM